MPRLLCSIGSILAVASVVTGQIAPLMEDNTAIVNVPGRADVGMMWMDSYSVGNRCYCASSFDFGADILPVTTPFGRMTIREVCTLLGPGPGSDGRPKYNDVQCGNGPANANGSSESDCPGRIEYGKGGCRYKGPAFNFTGVKNPFTTLAPSKRPISAAMAPTKVWAPTRPIQPPGKAPVAAPKWTPRAPTKPVKAPTKAPAKWAPVKAPVKAPMKWAHTAPMKWAAAAPSLPKAPTRVNAVPGHAPVKGPVTKTSGAAPIWNRPPRTGVAPTSWVKPPTARDPTQVTGAPVTVPTAPVTVPTVSVTVPTVPVTVPKVPVTVPTVPTQPKQTLAPVIKSPVAEPKTAVPSSLASTIMPSTNSPSMPPVTKAPTAQKSPPLPSPIEATKEPLPTPLVPQPPMRAPTVPSRKDKRSARRCRRFPKIAKALRLC